VTLDFDADLRPAGAGPDIGADEFGYWLHLPNALRSSP